MDNVRARVFSISVDAVDDDAFIAEVESMAKQMGNCVYQAVFDLFTDIELSEPEAQSHWRKLLVHRETMSRAMGRNVHLVAVISDYLTLHTQALENPKIVEISAFDKATQESTHDSLTGLFNQNYFQHVLENQFALARRYNSDLSLLFMDADDFKEVNDQYGHLAGDAALKVIANIIQDSIRESDIAARYGGEEFVVIMPQTNSIDALILGDRIRKLIANYSLTYNEHQISLTISGGIASFPANAKNSEELIYFADSALYRAKGAGKNNISLFKEDKRRFLRINFSQPLQVKELDFKSTETYAGLSKDICVGGILFENEKQLSLGAKIQINVPIGEGDPLLLIGTVVRVEMLNENRFDIGVVIAFKEMDKVAKNEISRFLFEQIDKK
ncbi:MAG: diguanylate cyclase [Hahellaceae bacterium]|nr:diguanylate cyclase [Hahellaceae bacterium]MCP5211379.1 diguanylate cyclase [Hahellaceae bacterium]